MPFDIYCPVYCTESWIINSKLGSVLLFRPQLLQTLILMYHDSSKEEVNHNVTETSVVSDYYKATLATFDEKVPLPAWRATEDHTL